MKYKKTMLLLITLVLFVGCTTQEQTKTKDTFGKISELTIFLPSENATWIYTGTGVYYHEMTLNDIIYSDQFIYYKINGEILSDEKSSNYNDYISEIRYVVSRKGWQQELQQSKLIDSKYKGMFLLKFPIEENNVWQEKVLDFDNNKKTVTGKIQSIDLIDGKKVITVKYSEKNSDYYEIRKMMQGKGVVEFEKKIVMNDEEHILRYSLNDFYTNEESLDYEIKTFLKAYNNAWQNYYNNHDSEIFDFIDNESTLVSEIKAFEKNDNLEIDFIELELKSVLVNDNRYQVEVNESFNIIKDEEEYIQSSIKKYTLVKENMSYKIIKVE